MGNNQRINYLRLSITERCNLRCRYCMPEGGITYQPRQEILTYEEIEFFTRCAIECGIEKVRLTGGEPLVRKDFPLLLGRIGKIKGIKDISMTTNGILLPLFASDLRKMGLKRINISLDSLNPEIYTYITGGDIREALRGIKSALKHKFNPIKINAVIMRGINDDLDDFIKFIYDFPFYVRFIEYMPIGNDNFWKRSLFISSQELEKRIKKIVKLEEIESPEGAGPAYYRKPKNALGAIGFISPLSCNICDDCNRLRLTADGHLLTCLFYEEEIDVKSILRKNSQKEDVIRIIKFALTKKGKKRNINKSRERTMSKIGG